MPGSLEHASRRSRKRARERSYFRGLKQLRGSGTCLLQTVNGSPRVKEVFWGVRERGTEGRGCGSGSERPIVSLRRRSVDVIGSVPLLAFAILGREYGDDVGF